MSPTKTNIDNLLEQYLTTRQKTAAICQPLEIEDYVIQPIAEVSPPKWHLGHTSWFFEMLILSKFGKNFKPYNIKYNQLFNSYYKALGTHTNQAERGHLSRPTVSELLNYRAYIDAQILEIVAENHFSPDFFKLLQIAIHHEQQHQELLYMDIKVILSKNTLETRYSAIPLNPAPQPKIGWKSFEEDLYEIGGECLAFPTEHFSYDNERPRHRHYLYPFSISQSLVSNGDFLAFIQDGAYSKAQYWLSQGWDWVKQQNIRCPYYWSNIEGTWYEYTLHGLLPLDLNRPLVHISYFEANAYANWKQLRLPTEQELEIFLIQSESLAQPKTKPNKKNIAHPNDANASSGQVWCWTSSQYAAYPQYKAFDGLLNEYNGKFMCNQFVLRGGCIVTPDGHYRHSYRNFYLAHQQWMYSGIRLAKDHC